MSPDLLPSPEPPAWIAPALWQRIANARDAELARGGSDEAALEAARLAALASWPAMPASHLTDALAVLSGHPPAMGISDSPFAQLRLAPRGDLIDCLVYALANDARGKA